VPYKTIWIDPELQKQIIDFGRRHGEKSLIYGIRWSTALRELIIRGLKYDGIGKEAGRTETGRSEERIGEAAGKSQEAKITGTD
jgi:hypothetical protein